MNSMNQIFGQKTLQPYVRIVEQPARSAVRFRYECEGRSAGPIPGANATPTCATYPTIQIMNYAGSRAMVVVSCVTVSQPYKQHPHHLVGRVGCQDGICTMVVDNTDHLCTFTHLGIQCAKRNEISTRLKLRKSMHIDPTYGGFEHITKSCRGVDLGAVRLCFQVYLEGPEPDKFCIPLEAVVSDPVYDKKLLSKLSVTDISTNNAIATGGKVMLFCNYIDEDDIEVVFYECDHTGTPIWQSSANLKPPFGDVHKRVGMSFMAPPYRDVRITQVVKCFMKLRRTSDHEASDPIIFYYLPINPSHNCSLIGQHQNTSRGLNLGGYQKKFKTNLNLQQISDQSLSNEVAVEKKPGMANPIACHNLLKFEDIDNDLDVIPEATHVQQNELNTNGKLLIKSEIIQNLFNGQPMVQENMNWHVPTGRSVADTNPLIGQNQSDELKVEKMLNIPFIDNC